MATSVPNHEDPCLPLFCPDRCKAMEEMFLSAIHSDVEFAVGDEIIPAHKNLLATQLPYFKTLFASGMKESSSNRIEIKDADAHIFKGFLRYIYCNQLPDNFEEIAEIYLPMAEKYDVPPLKEECILALKKRVAKNNVVEMLTLADLYRCPMLKSKCLRLIQKFRFVLDRDALARLSPELMLDAFTYQGDEEEEEEDDGASEASVLPDSASADDDPLGFLRTRPQFARMRSLIQQDPSLLPAVLQQLVTANPQLLRLINHHPQRFIEMLNEPADA